MLRVVSTLAVCIGFVAPTYATTIFTWDNDAQSFSGIAGFSDTIGVTDGTHSAMHDPGNGFGWGLQTGNWNPSWPALEAALAVGSILKFDVTATDEDPLDGELTVGAWVWHSGGNGSAGAAVVASDGSTTTVELDVSAFSDWTQLRLFTNASGAYDPGTIYYDNLRVEPIPEPASLTLMALGVLVASRRRRR